MEANEDIPLNSNQQAQRVRPLDNEEALKRRVRDQPALVGVEDLSTAVATEMSMPGVGTADVVIVDSEGAITIVECKLAENPQHRRWVIGQVLEYAAAVWRLDYENFERRFENSSDTKLMAPLAASSLWDEARFQAALSANLEAGDFRLVIAVDEVTIQLARAVAYLNDRTAPGVRVQAVGLHQVADDGFTILPPTFFGDEYVDRVPPRMPRPRPSRHLLLEGIRSRSARDAEVAGQILDWAEGRQELEVRYTPNDGVIELSGESLFRIAHHARVQVSLYNFAEPWDAEEAERLTADFADLSAILDHRKRLIVQLEELGDERRREEFLEDVLEAMMTWMS